LSISSTVTITRASVLYKRALRFWEVGLLLHFVTGAGLILFFWSGLRVLNILGQGQGAELFWYGGIAGYGLVLPFFAQLDAASRYQDYKKVKDLLYETGFKPRVVQLFMNSRCQRDAVKVAARDLGLTQVLIVYYKTKGYAWFHLLPEFVFKKPMVVFTKRYWQRTLFEQRYERKHFLW